MTVQWCSNVADGTRIVVHIQPNARRTESVGIFDGVWKIRLQAQPVDGKANDALIAYLADKLAVPKSTIEITHGHTSKRKMVLVRSANLTAEAVLRTFMSDESPRAKSNR